MSSYCAKIDLYFKEMQQCTKKMTRMPMAKKSGHAAKNLLLFSQFIHLCISDKSLFWLVTIHDLSLHGLAV